MPVPSAPWRGHFAAIEEFLVEFSSKIATTDRKTGFVANAFSSQPRYPATL
jgi:hypothetical protein